VKRKILYVGLCLLTVAVLLPSLALSSCTKATTSTAPTTSKTAANVPVYGGAITELNDVAAQDPSSWDPHLSQTGNVTSVYVNPYIDWYFYGDIDKFGPRGNGQSLFQLPQYIPDQYLTGGIAQSWVFNTSPLSLTVTLKQGIMWTGNSHIGMAPRELTSADCAFSGTRQITAPAVAFVFTWIKDCVAVDKYTFRWDFNTFYANWQFFLLYGGASAVSICPESANATGGAADWRNAVGTGPFILSNYVSGTSATYTRNPNYWGKTTINGKQYQEPFIDSLTYLVVPDQSTQLAALRTAKIDLWTQVAYSNASSLKQQAPNMIQEPWLSCSVDILMMNRLDTGPLTNINVRQALFMATDFKTVMNLVYGGGDILGWPVARGNPSYTPVENLPASTQALFTYNPTKAQQMLTAAGYPNGFSTSIVINSAIAQEADEATALASEWAKVGVTLQITQMNTVSLAAQKNNRSYAGLLDFPVATANPLTPIMYYTGTSMGAIYKSGEPLTVEAVTVTTDQDTAKRQADVTQWCKDAIADAGILSMANPYILNCYWPWLKNYYGEIDGGYHNQVVMIREMWIDQNLKKSMGY
jgi:peptide/nickel transport system substrate-binding protein